MPTARHLRQTNTPPPGRLWPRRQPKLKEGHGRTASSQGFRGHKITNPNNAVFLKGKSVTKILLYKLALVTNSRKIGYLQNDPGSLYSFKV